MITPAGLHVVASLPASRRNGRHYVLLSILGALMLVWLGSFVLDSRAHYVPRGAGIGADYAMFLGGARVLQAGGNPYDHNLLFRTEHQFLSRHGVEMTARRDIVRVGNPPLFLWFLEPLTRFPFRLTAVAWIFTMYALSAVGFFLVITHFGWRRRVLPCILFLLMPPSVLGVAHANNSALLFVAVAGALALARRYPLVAGLILGLAWLKPQVGLPLVLLITLFHTSHSRQSMAGFAIGSASLLALTCLTTGLGSVQQWIAGLAGYGHDIAAQTAIPSLAGAYVLWASPPLRMGLSVLFILIACILTFLHWWRLRGTGETDFLQSAPLWSVWFMATPYTHVSDEILLAIPIVALVGRDAVRAREWFPAFCLFAMFFATLRGVWPIVALPIFLLVLVLAQRDTSTSLASWKVVLPCIAVGLWAALHYIPVPMNSQFLALGAVTLCLTLAARTSATVRETLPGVAPPQLLYLPLEKAQ